MPKSSPRRCSSQRAVSTCTAAARARCPDPTVLHIRRATLQHSSLGVAAGAAAGGHSAAPCACIVYDGRRALRQARRQQRHWLGGQTKSAAPRQAWPHSVSLKCRGQEATLTLPNPRPRPPTDLVANLQCAHGPNLELPLPRHHLRVDTADAQARLRGGARAWRRSARGDRLGQGQPRLRHASLLKAAR